MSEIHVVYMCRYAGKFGVIYFTRLGVLPFLPSPGMGINFDEGNMMLHVTSSTMIERGSFVDRALVWDDKTEELTVELEDINDDYIPNRCSSREEAIHSIKEAGFKILPRV
ncbi:MAG: hypothetical protein ABIJ57_01775 [Pseudomonadota bacterium]